VGELRTQSRDSLAPRARQLEAQGGCPVAQQGSRPPGLQLFLYAACPGVGDGQAGEGAEGQVCTEKRFSGLCMSWGLL
jgi:hypothetical protein